MRKLFPVMAVCGAATIFYGFYGVIRAVNAGGWPVAEGIVTVSRVEAAKAPAQSPAHIAVIKYVFEAGGAKHENDAISFGETDSGHLSQA
ncbi:MAG: hypothetical protein HZB29_10265 [Nitrospinae bacterium]|nr:hypothetical protein [Nitrospinota bacterium]